MADAVRKTGYAVRSLARGLRILSSFTVEHPEWGVSDLSRQLNLDKATVFRLTKTLEASGFVVSDRANGKYRVGSALLRIAYVGGLRSELLRAARPFLVRLAEETGESVDLAIWTDEGVLFVDQVLTSRPFKPVSRVGRVFADVSNAHSKVFCAFMPEDERAAILGRPLAPLTPFSTIDAQSLVAEIRNVAAQGVAYDLQEHTVGVCAVAAPIWGPPGRVRASLAVVAPADRFGPSEAASFTEAVKRSAEATSRELGYPEARKPSPS